MQSGRRAQSGRLVRPADVRAFRAAPERALRAITGLHFPLCLPEAPVAAQRLTSD